MSPPKRAPIDAKAFQACCGVGECGLFDVEEKQGAEVLRKALGNSGAQPGSCAGDNGYGRAHGRCVSSSGASSSAARAAVMTSLGSTLVTTFEAESS